MASVLHVAESLGRRIIWSPAPFQLFSPADTPQKQQGRRPDRLNPRGKEFGDLPSKRQGFKIPEMQFGIHSSRT